MKKKVHPLSNLYLFACCFQANCLPRTGTLRRCIVSAIFVEASQNLVSFVWLHASRAKHRRYTRYRTVDLDDKCGKNGRNKIKDESGEQRGRKEGMEKTSERSYIR